MGWDDDDDMFGEESDLGDEDSEPEPPITVFSPPSPRPEPVVETAPLRRPFATKPAASLAPASARRLKVKPMSSGMRAKWPDVATCLLTLQSGRQVMFVRS